MKRNLWISIIFAALACIPLCAAQAQLTFNYCDTLNPQIKFASPSPNGGIASVAFQSGAILPLSTTISAVKAASNVNPNLTYQILWCPFTPPSPKSGGGYLAANKQTLTNPTPSNSTSLTPIANSSGMMVIQYQDSASVPWTSFDRVTIMDSTFTPVLNQAGLPGGTMYYFVNCKSKDGTHGASVIVIVTSTADTPVLPPHKKKR